MALDAPVLNRLTPSGDILTASESLDAALEAPYDYRGWEDVYRDLDLGQGRQGHPYPRELHLRVLDRCLRERRDRLARRTERHLREVVRRTFPTSTRADARSGCVYSSADVRPDAHQVPDEARRQTRLRQVGAALLGPGPDRDRRQADRRRRPRDGPECIVYDNGTTNLDFGIGSPMEAHLFTTGLGAPTIDSYAGVGDLPVGLIQTWGLYMIEGTADDWFLSDYILDLDRQPFLHAGARSALPLRGALPRREGRQHRARLQRLDDARRPLAERRATATDAALALGMVSVIIDERPLQG